jgi:putative flippase GtrA
MLTGIPVEDTSSATYVGVYTAAQIIQWIASVLVAFYTNKKWVFTDAKKDASTAKQLFVFAGGRVLTFFLDYGVTFFGAIALSSLLPMFNSFALLGREFNLNEIAAKFIAAVLVIIGNYFFSKILVFKKGDGTNDNHNS